MTRGYRVKAAICHKVKPAIVPENVNIKLERLENSVTLHKMINARRILPTVGQDSDAGGRSGK